jgi:hypothetical protein
VSSAYNACQRWKNLFLEFFFAQGATIKLTSLQQLLCISLIDELMVYFRLKSKESEPNLSKKKVY